MDAMTSRAFTRRARSIFLLAAISAFAAGCAVERYLPRNYSDLPESPDVETAPWPRLVDSPAVLEPEAAQERIAKGDALEAEMEARMTTLETEAAILLSEEVVEDDVQARIARARAAGAELAAEE